MSKRRSSRRPTGGQAPRRLRPIQTAGFILVALAIFFVARIGLLPSGATTSTPVPATPLVVAADSDGTTSAANDAVSTLSAPAPAEATPGSAAQATRTPQATATAQATTPTPTANAPPSPTRASALPTIAYADLPVQAHDTIRLIEQGGPFPFDRDGITFQNRERLLPLHTQGYYREYTVITPGERTRGARRIVAGAGGEMYYTDDHYDSFREIVR